MRAILFLDPPDGGAELLEFDLQVFIAAVQVVDTMDLRSIVRHQAGQDQAGTGP